MAPGADNFMSDRRLFRSIPGAHTIFCFKECSRGIDKGGGTNFGTGIGDAIGPSGAGFDGPSDGEMGANIAGADAGVGCCTVVGANAGGETIAGKGGDALG